MVSIQKNVFLPIFYCFKILKIAQKSTIYKAKNLKNQKNGKFLLKIIIKTIFLAENFTKILFYLFNFTIKLLVQYIIEFILKKCIIFLKKSLFKMLVWSQLLLVQDKIALVCREFNFLQACFVFKLKLSGMRPP